MNIGNIFKKIGQGAADAGVPKKLLQSNRFKATVVGLIISIATYYGLPLEIANQVGEVVFYLIATYVLADTLRPSVK
jgi:hypothetical protein